MFFAVSLATSLPKHVPDDPFSIHSPHRTVPQAIPAMESIIPTIGASQAGPALRTNHYTACPWPDLPTPQEAQFHQNERPPSRITIVATELSIVNNDSLVSFVYCIFRT